MSVLIKKAGLDYLHPDNADALYDILLENKKQLDQNHTIISKWQELVKDLTNISKSYSKLM